MGADTERCVSVQILVNFVTTERRFVSAVLCFSPGWPPQDFPDCHSVMGSCSHVSPPDSSCHELEQRPVSLHSVSHLLLLLCELRVIVGHSTEQMGPGSVRVSFNLTPDDP
jgi:hypothetical protein